MFIKKVLKNKGFVLAIISLLLLIGFNEMTVQAKGFCEKFQTGDQSIVARLDNVNWQTAETIKLKFTELESDLSLIVYVEDRIINYIPSQVYQLRYQPRVENDDPEFESYRQYLRRQKVCGSGYIKPQDLTILKDADQINKALAAPKYSLITKLSQKVEPNALGLLLGLTTGEIFSFDPDLEDKFKNVGITHVVAVSGANFTMVIAAISLALKKLPVPNKAKTVLIIIISTIYLYYVGFDNLPAFRAYLFTMMIFLQKLTGRKISKLNSVVIALLGMQFVVMHAYADLGLRLSIIAWFMITVILKGLSKKFEFLPETIRDEFVMSFLGSLVLMPVSLLFFEQVNLLSAPYNAVLVPLFSLLSIFAFPVIFSVSILPVVLSDLILTYYYAFSHFVLSLVSIFSQFSLDLDITTHLANLLIFVFVIFVIMRVINLIKSINENKELEEYYF